MKIDQPRGDDLEVDIEILDAHLKKLTIKEIN